MSGRVLFAALVVGCTRSEAPAPTDAGRAVEAAELTITFEPPDASSLSLRSDGTFSSSSGAEPKLLGRPSTASVFALADEAFASLGGCSDAGAGPRVRVTYTRAGTTQTAAHARGDESCGRGLGMLERRMLGLR